MPLLLLFDCVLGSASRLKESLATFATPSYSLPVSLLERGGQHVRCGLGGVLRQVLAGFIRKSSAVFDRTLLF